MLDPSQDPLTPERIHIQVEDKEEDDELDSKTFLVSSRILTHTQSYLHGQKD